MAAMRSCISNMVADRRRSLYLIAHGHDAVVEMPNGIGTAHHAPGVGSKNLLMKTVVISYMTINNVAALPKEFK